MNSEVLKRAGIDFEHGVDRFLGDRQLYESILITFLTDDTFVQGKNALEKGNFKGLYESVHTLKGIAGNTDMITFYHTAGVLGEHLRKCEVMDEDEVIRLFNEMQEAYYAVMKGIIDAKEK
ncbi:MAG: Hpt domain-containing protein [Anaerotignum sp.]|nr:Hpt domain-containing protein [Anaerotignum sp.]